MNKSAYTNFKKEKRAYLIVKKLVLINLGIINKDNK
ncbi:hypothetical protein HNR35_000972 [Borreliella spielmanii]|uniref:Uncharacterized protein n=2 Tax=Borreliella TaxID=64895 RepID=A0ABR6P7K7_9SPIR|nr:hypothetical protein [Borreliella afzelii]MBB6031969.1 hypothetical protein [Borreliella spielmanii]